MKLVLFDIDGTLLFCDGAGRKSMGDAIKSIFGFDGFPEGYSLAGCTDKQIIFDVLEHYGAGREEIDKKMENVLECYYEFLKINTSSGEHKKRLLTGVPPLLEELRSNTEHVLLGLLTGNLRQSALLKLSLFNLQDYFLYDGELFGGFGSDHPERSRLVNISRNRAFNMTGKIFVGKDIVVIGDTKNDILCGKHLGVKSIAVATGEYSSKELLQYEPDYIFEDFSDTRKVVDVILS
jgi:phosphoglycolate phosphatase-like HAD superfamily hydrolase